jgi:hypothetical protein
MSLLLRPFKLEDEEAAVAAYHAFVPDDFTFLLGYRDGMTWRNWILDTWRIRRRGPTPGQSACSVPGPLTSMESS